MNSTIIGKILIVDDEHINAEVIKDTLEDVHYQVSLAFNADQAQSMVAQQVFDLVMMDIWMPGIDGISLLKSWKERGIATAVVIMSGHGDIQTAVEAMKLGAIDYFSKPIHDLLPRIRDVFARLASQQPMSTADYLDLPLKEARNAFEQAYFLHHLQQNHYNITKVASIAQLERTTLYRKLKDLGIDKR